MSRETFDRLRVPIALGVALMLLAGYLFLQRADADSGTAGLPTASIVVGEPGGGVVTPSPSPTIAPSPSPSVEPTPTPSASPTPAPPPDEGFTAEVMACRSLVVAEADCIDETSRLRERDETFVALVLFDNARAGDVMNAILDGPSGPIEGGAFALEGSGRGFYYSTFAIGSLPDGQYTLTALRNGEPVARTELRKSDDD